MLAARVLPEKGSPKEATSVVATVKRALGGELSREATDLHAKSFGSGSPKTLQVSGGREDP